MKLLDELGFTNDKLPDGDSFSQDDGRCLVIPSVYEVYRGYIVFAFSVCLFIPPVYEVYRGYIVFAFSVCLFVCV